jgi:glutaconate CoA-transferase subunit B
MMVVAAARQIRDGQVVNVGMRLPLIAFAVAKKTHAPNAVGVFDAGILRQTPIEQGFFTMCDPANVRGAAWITDMLDLMHWMQAGHVDLGFLGGAEVDRFGNINTSYIGDPQTPRVKLPGSGGAADIAGLSRQTVIIMAGAGGALHYLAWVWAGRHDAAATGTDGRPSGDCDISWGIRV